MLKDRRNIMEQEIAKMTMMCGQMYVAAMQGNPSMEDRIAYTDAVQKLSTMKTELVIVTSMINAGYG